MIDKDQFITNYNKIKDFKIDIFNKYESDDMSKYHLEKHLKIFLVLKSMDTEVSPSFQIDRIWHHFLLYTKMYQDFCETLGTFIHHCPEFNPDDQLKRYNKTCKILEEIFPLIKIDSNFGSKLWKPYENCDCCHVDKNEIYNCSDHYKMCIECLKNTGGLYKGKCHVCHKSIMSNITIKTLTGKNYEYTIESICDTKKLYQMISKDIEECHNKIRLLIDGSCVPNEGIIYLEQNQTIHLYLILRGC